MSVQLYARNGKSKPTKKGKKGTKKNPRAASKAHKSSRMHKGFLDTAESIAGMLPGAIKGVRGVLGNFKQSSHREAVFATPASFASVSNNITEMSPEGPVSHPTLGITGTRLSFSQPLANVTPGVVALAGRFFDPSAGPAVIGFTLNQILLAPYILQGPLAFRAASFEKYVFRRVRIKFITYQATTFLGTCVLCVESDPGNTVANSFQTARMVTPSVTFPYRIPEAVLEYVYDGPELYFTAAPVGGDIAQARQCHQAIVQGYDAGGLIAAPVLTGFMEISGDIEFYDPIPPLSITAQNLRERLAIHSVLTAMRPVRVLAPVRGESVVDKKWLDELSAAAGSCPADLLDQVTPDDDDDDDYPHARPEMARSESIRREPEVLSLLGRALRSPYASPAAPGSRLP